MAPDLGRLEDDVALVAMIYGGFFELEKILNLGFDLIRQLEEEDDDPIVIFTLQLENVFTWAELICDLNGVTVTRTKKQNRVSVSNKRETRNAKRDTRISILSFNDRW